MQIFYTGHLSSLIQYHNMSRDSAPSTTSHPHMTIIKFHSVWVFYENHQLMIPSQRIIRTDFKHKITSSHTRVIFLACISLDEWIFNQNSMSLRLAILDTIFSKWKSNHGRSNHLASHSSPALHIRSNPLP